nr:hypothetical protein KitaXyl93_72230 [Kitasatospora sp. Xyl93]
MPLSLASVGPASVPGPVLQEPAPLTRGNLNRVPAHIRRRRPSVRPGAVGAVRGRGGQEVCGVTRPDS